VILFIFCAPTDYDCIVANCLYVRLWNFAQSLQLPARTLLTICSERSPVEHMHAHCMKMPGVCEIPLVVNIE